MGCMHDHCFRYLVLIWIPISWAINELCKRAVFPHSDLKGSGCQRDGKMWNPKLHSLIDHAEGEQTCHESFFPHKMKMFATLFWLPSCPPFQGTMVVNTPFKKTVWVTLPQAPHAWKFSEAVCKCVALQSVPESMMRVKDQHASGECWANKKHR